MPNIMSAKKRMKTSAIAQKRNRAAKSEVSSLKVKFLQVVTGGDKVEASKLFSEYCSLLDRSVKRGILKANTVDRKKARAAKKLAAI